MTSRARRALAAVTLLATLTACSKIPVVNKLSMPKMPRISLWPKSWSTSAPRPAPATLPSPTRNTVYGSLQLLHRRLETGDPAQIAPFLHCDNDPDGRYVAAIADRIAASMIFHATVRDRFNTDDFEGYSLGLLDPNDFSTLLLCAWQPAGNRATGTLPTSLHLTGRVIPLRQVDNQWTLDVTPPGPATDALIQSTQRHTAAVNQVALLIQRGKASTLAQATQALRRNDLPQLNDPTTRWIPNLIPAAAQ